MEDIFREAKQMQAELVECERALHKIPEVGESLPKTTAYIKKKL